MTYAQARAFIDESNKFGSKLGLETISELLRRLGNPQDKLKVIHVAGTNGKGSTTAFIATILASQGYLVGRYISPAVFTYQERVQISRLESKLVVTDYITEVGISNAIDKIQPLCDEMVKDGFSHPTSFEIETAMAFLYLVFMQVDYAVIEVGMGGRLDATNVIKKPMCCVLTSISMDHMQYLGDTLEKIATEKAGIIQKNTMVVTANTEPEVLQVINSTCEKQYSKLIVTHMQEVTEAIFSPEGTSFTYLGNNYIIGLLGEYQIGNAILAIQTMNALREKGITISEEAVKEGLAQAKWSGRLEVLAREPYVIIDGAHNEDAAQQLKKAMERYFNGRRWIYIIGVLADKDYTGILRIMAPFAEVILTITPDNNRALASTQLAIEAKKYCSGCVIDAGTVEQAIHTAMKEAGKEDVILAFGSLSYLSEVKTVLSDK